MRSVPSISALTAGISLSACTQARTKKPMKPSFTPCFFANRSLYWLRSAITWLMSTSLKVVSMAAVFCASLRRRAMVWRSLVILTRSSRAASSAGEGGRSAGAVLDLTEQRADRDGVAVLGRHVGKHAGGGRRHLDRHLVGLELDQRLVDRDGVARLLEPAADRRLADRFAEGGNADLSHRAFLLPASPDVTRVFPARLPKTRMPGR